MICRRGSSLLVALLLLGQIFLPCNALSSGLLIIYPNVKAPYNKIYKEIIKGIEKDYEGLTNQLKIMPNNSDQILTKKIDQYEPDVLQALAKKSTRS